MWESRGYVARRDGDALVVERERRSALHIWVIALSVGALLAAGNAIMLPMTWRGAMPWQDRAVLAGALATLACAFAVASHGLARRAKPRMRTLFVISRGVVAWGAQRARGADATLGRATVWMDGQVQSLTLDVGDGRVEIFRDVPTRLDEVEQAVRDALIEP